MKHLRGKFSREPETKVSEGGIRFPHHMYISLSDKITEGFDIPGVSLIAIANRLDVMLSNNSEYTPHNPIVDMSEAYEIGMHRDLVEMTMDNRSEVWKRLW